MWYDPCSAQSVSSHVRELSGRRLLVKLLLSMVAPMMGLCVILWLSMGWVVAVERYDC
jgi:hypothetical protein